MKLSEINQNVLAIALAVAAIVIVTGAWFIWGRGPGAVAPTSSEQNGRAKMEEQMRKMYGPGRNNTQTGANR